MRRAAFFATIGFLNDLNQKTQTCICINNTLASVTDGISYLIAVKGSDIHTPLMAEYEKEILARTQTTDLQQALDKLKPGGREKTGQ